MSGKTARLTSRGFGLIIAALAAGTLLIYLRREAPIPTVAFVPQSAGALLWDVAQFGARTAAKKFNCHLYWSAPAWENDIAGQVAVIDRVSHGPYQGMVVAPNHMLSVLAPVRNAVQSGMPVVVISTQLDLPANSKLGYVVNDDEKMGEMAAAEIARLIQGKGSVILLGMTRAVPGVSSRVRGAERFFASRFPNIHVANRLGGAYDASRAEILTTGELELHPNLSAILSLTATSTRGVHAALKNHSISAPPHHVGCEQDADLMTFLEKGELAALVAENTYRMGFDAVGLILDSLAGKPLPARSLVAPFLLTRQNSNSPDATIFTSFPK